MRILLITWALGVGAAAADPTPTRCDDPRADLAVRRDCAYAAMIAVREQLRAAPSAPVGKADDAGFDPTPRPRPLDAASQRLVDAATLFLTLAPDEHGPRHALARFTRLNTLRRFDHLDEAVPDMIQILEHERGEEVWMYSANLLLDALIRLERYDDLIVWVRRLRGDKLLAISEPELADRLRLIEQQWSRKEAERREKAGAFVACGEAYDQARAIDPAGWRVDETLFNAGVCFERGAAAERALARYAELIRAHRRSPLAAKARGRSARLRLARFDLAGAARDAGSTLGLLSVVVRPLAAALAPSRLLFRP